MALFLASFFSFTHSQSSQPPWKVTNFQSQLLSFSSSSSSSFLLFLTHTIHSAQNLKSTANSFRTPAALEATSDSFLSCPLFWPSLPRFSLSLSLSLSLSVLQYFHCVTCKPKLLHHKYPFLFFALCLFFFLLGFLSIVSCFTTAFLLGYLGSFLFTLSSSSSSSPFLTALVSWWTVASLEEDRHKRESNFEAWNFATETIGILSVTLHCDFYFFPSPNESTEFFPISGTLCDSLSLSLSLCVCVCCLLRQWKGNDSQTGAICKRIQFNFFYFNCDSLRMNLDADFDVFHPSIFPRCEFIMSFVHSIRQVFTLAAVKNMRKREREREDSWGIWCLPW